MSTEWPKVRLGEVLKPVSRPVTVEPNETYRILGAHWYAKGLYTKEVKDGSQIRAKTLYRIEEGDFVYNRLFAWKGSFAIATDENDGCYASNEFPCFSINRERVDGQYLWRYFSRASAWNEALGLSTGGTPTSRNRLKENKFLAMKIPLPPLDEQRRTVARIEELAARIEEAQDLRRRAAEEVKELDRQFYGLAWSKSEMMSNFKLLGEVADVIDPQPDHRTPPELSDGMPYVSIKNIDPEGNVDILNARKVSPDVIKLQELSFTLKTGDIVLGKIGTIGAARALRVNGRFALSANVVLVQPNRNKILDRMLLLLLRAPQIEKQFEKGSRKTAQTAFGIKKMRKLRVPLPHLKEQRRIVARLDELQAHVDGLKRCQARTAEELDALLPAVLERAFRGELGSRAAGSILIIL